MQRQLIIFTDIGDTIIDEGTEYREVPCGVVYHAACIPGAREAMLKLYEEGYQIVMVADGLIESFTNTMRENGLSHIFAARAISEEIGIEKPRPEIFRLAMERMGLTDEDKYRVVMVGNNVHRDMVGARRFGIRSIQLAWSPRYPVVTEDPEELADYRIYSPEELPGLIDALEQELGGGSAAEPDEEEKTA